MVPEKIVKLSLKGFFPPYFCSSIGFFFFRPASSVYACCLEHTCPGYDGFHRPEPVVFNENVAENCHIFEREYSIFIAAAHHDKPAYILFNIMGPDGIERERSFVYSAAVHDEDRAIITPAESDCLKRKFCEICNPLCNRTVERHKFHPEIKDRMTALSLLSAI